MNSEISYLEPSWSVPDNVHCLVTTRPGGVSADEFTSFNLATHVGDEAETVELNRARLHSHIGTENKLQWINQVHGEKVLSLTREVVDDALIADAIYTRKTKIACGVLTADCLPVFFCDQNGDEIAVAHAGWRGLSAGILENTITGFQSKPENILAWMGPAIGPCHFEVGEEVREAFMRAEGSFAQAEGSFAQAEGSFVLAEGSSFQGGIRSAFKPSHNKNKWMADLYQLARIRLGNIGLNQVSGGGLCTYCDKVNFYSYRRDGNTGRMASLIYKS